MSWGEGTGVDLAYRLVGRRRGVWEMHRVTTAKIECNIAEELVHAPAIVWRRVARPHTIWGSLNVGHVSMKLLAERDARSSVNRRGNLSGTSVTL